MKPVCLIIPPSVFLLDERVFMNLGILRVASVLEQNGYTVEMLDLSGIQNYEDVVRLHASNSDADVFGITSTTPQMPAAFNIAKLIHETRPNAKTILGGPHITLVNAARKREVMENRVSRAHSAYQKLARTFTTLIAGDGEEAVVYAIKNNFPELIDADDPKSPLFLTNTKLNHLPFPARHLVDADSYHYQIEGERALSLIAQLGCPFECGFCGGRLSPMLRRVRMRTSENIVEEIKQIHEKYKVKGFMLYDDELNVNTKMIELMNKIRDYEDEVGSDFKLRGFVKAELFTNEQAEAMYKAGFRWLLVGFESGSTRILKNINKKATLKDNTKCVEIAKHHGFKVKALMSIGHPGESQETIMETHDWLLKVKPDDFDVTIITTYPGTPYYDQAVKENQDSNIWVYTFKPTGDKLYAHEVDYTQVADYYKGDPNGGYKSYVYTDYLPAEELVKLRDFVERSVRQNLQIPFNPSNPSVRYEHSMGQLGGPLPNYILKTTETSVLDK
ncbi:MAG: B12-binding domain-containing radical SAM protein [Planctomycetes bacterium]|nr:B12-binding domain-containing radical SAM protein [Planctomycetota bacterium]